MEETITDSFRKIHAAFLWDWPWVPQHFEWKTNQLGVTPAAWKPAPPVACVTDYWGWQIMHFVDRLPSQSTGGKLGDVALFSKSQATYNHVYLHMLPYGYCHYLKMALAAMDIVQAINHFLRGAIKVTVIEEGSVPFSFLSLNKSQRATFMFLISHWFVFNFTLIVTMNGACGSNMQLYFWILQ